MKSKHAIIIACIVIPIVICPIFLLRSNSNVVSEKNGSELKANSATYNAKFQHMSDQSNHLFYFVQVSTELYTQASFFLLILTKNSIASQISDLHISKFRNLDRIRDFRAFVHETLDTIKPPVVVASGDLTDGRGLDSYISQQNADEWKTYNKILWTANVEKRTKWLDIRGNHGKLMRALYGIQ